MTMEQRYKRGWLTYSRAERNRLRRGEWFRNGAIYRRQPKEREPRDRFDRMLATARRQIANGRPVTVCGSVVEAWDQTVGCPRCGGEAWTRPLGDFDILHPAPWTMSCPQCHRAPSRDCTFGRCKADEPRDTIEAPPVEAGRSE
jgi:hypothetical protein